MDLKALGLFLKMLQEEYSITDAQKKVLTDRMLADSSEFERVWKLYRTKAKRKFGGEDPFRPILRELLS